MLLLLLLSTITKRKDGVILMPSSEARQNQPPLLMMLLPSWQETTKITRNEICHLTSMARSHRCRLLQVLYVPFVLFVTHTERGVSMSFAVIYRSPIEEPGLHC